MSRDTIKVINQQQEYIDSRLNEVFFFVGEILLFKKKVRMFKKTVDNSKENLRRRGYKLILIIFLLTSTIFLLGSAMNGGIYTFFFVLLGILFNAMIFYFLISFLKKGALLTILLFANVFFSHEVNKTMTYCAEPTKPSWHYTISWDSPEYNGVPNILRVIYKIGANPCGIPMEYIHEDGLIRDRH